MIKAKTEQAKAEAREFAREKREEIKEFVAEKEQKLVKKAQFWQE
jgi:NADH-quinone oxidoreductase subunit B